MKTVLATYHAPLLAVLLAFARLVGTAAESNVVHVQFREVDMLFANPGQGWMSQQRSPRGEPRFPCSVVYIRFNWADAEPEEGNFNWKLIDDVIAAWKPRGAAVAMRVMTCNAHSSGYYTSPKWLFDAGCRSFEYLVGGDDHVTLINDNIGRVPPEAMPQLEKLARLAGARFVLRELAHEKTVKHGAPLNLQMKWANVGAGKLIHPYALRLYLLNAARQPVLGTNAKADPRDWLPGEYNLTESVPIPSALGAGDYTVALTLADPSSQRRPWRLAMDAPENEGRYEISSVKVE